MCLRTQTLRRAAEHSRHCPSKGHQRRSRSELSERSLGFQHVQLLVNELQAPLRPNSAWPSTLTLSTHEQPYRGHDTVSPGEGREPPSQVRPARQAEPELEVFAALPLNRGALPDVRDTVAATAHGCSQRGAAGVHRQWHPWQNYVKNLFANACVAHLQRPSRITSSNSSVV